MAVQQTKVTVNVRDDLLEKARAIAEAENKTVTEVINEALRVRQLIDGGTVLVKTGDEYSQILI